MTVAGSYCAGSSAGLGLTGGKVVLPVRPVPSASTVNITAPAAAAKPIIFFGSIVVPGMGGILLPRSVAGRSEEHTSELQSLMRISYAVFCLKKKKTKNNKHQHVGAIILEETSTRE